jgi:type VI secretion system FHA domain protein
VRDLRDGDRVRLGAYEIEVRISQEAAWTPAPQVSDPFGDDPFGNAPKPAARGFEQDSLLSSGQGFGTPSVTLPADYDPMAPEPGSDGFRGATQADHGSAMNQAFRPAEPSKIDFDDWDLDLSKPAAGGAPPPDRPAPAADPLDEWDIDLSPAAPPPQAVAAPVPVPTPAPAQALAPIAFVAPVEPPADPFAEPERDGGSPVPVLPPIPVAAPPAMAAPASVAPASVAAASGPDLLAAFLRGAGMSDARPTDAEVAMERLGAAFRALVVGLRQTLIERRAFKGEFRIEQTMIRARGNNPLKFSAGDDDALAALIGAGRRSEMAPAAAVAEALDDIRRHEMASMAAMQAAARALVDRLDPAPLRAEGEKSGGLLGAQKRARAFELFEKLHADIAAALADDFDSAFGKAFARAYEQALREAGGSGS